MFKILFDSSLEDDEKKKKAAENLVFLSRDEAGAERIFRDGGTSALSDLVDNESPEIKLAAIRTVSGICDGHQARVSTYILNSPGLLPTMSMTRVQCDHKCNTQSWFI